MPKRHPAVEHAAELVTATFAQDDKLIMEILNDLDAAEVKYTAAALAALVKTMLDRLAHVSEEDSLELWQRLSQRAAQRWLEEGNS